MTDRFRSLPFAAALVVGEGSVDTGAVSAALSHAARSVHQARDVNAAIDLADSVNPQLIILSENIPVAEAMLFLSRIKHLCPQALTIAVADNPQIENAMALVKAGLTDYLPGPLDEARVEELLAGLEDELASLDQGPDRFLCDQCPPGVPMVGRSEAMVSTLYTLRVIALSRCNPILILGQTGTGKELAARAVHAWRHESKAPFVAVNCAALTANLLESELFGHVRGAFTGADREKIGLFEAAENGTIFLDEISEMPLDLQAKLLRVLQERVFRKVGGTSDIACNATVVASSNRDLLTEANEGRFRKDLYYRLAVFPVELPALAATGRRSDIAVLAEFFVANSDIVADGGARTITKPAIQKLLSHDWPGNVRELKNVIDRAIILSQGRQIEPQDVVLGQSRGAVDVAASDSTSNYAADAQDPQAFSLETAEREFILRALKETGWQRTRAAALLGITRATLHSKLKRYGIEAPNATSDANAASQPSRMKEMASS